MQIEIWKDVVDFEGLYEVSNLGNFRRHSSLTLNTARKVHENRLGYLYASLSKLGVTYKKTVHQLVARAFIEGFSYGDAVNHIDGNKQNNAVINLEKTTSQDNNIHAYTIGLRSKPGNSIYHYVHIVKEKYKDKIYISYQAKIKYLGKVVFNKQFKNEIDAAKAVDSYLDSINDTRRRRNFPKPYMSND